MKQTFQSTSHSGLYIENFTNRFNILEAKVVFSTETTDWLPARVASRFDRLVNNSQNVPAFHWWLVLFQALIMSCDKCRDDPIKPGPIDGNAVLFNCILNSAVLFLLRSISGHVLQRSTTCYPPSFSPLARFIPSVEENAHTHGSHTLQPRALNMGQMKDPSVRGREVCH